jgi:secreted Zn-dependent insulinase-like peptidase
MEKILTALQVIQIDAQRFDVIKEQTKREFQNFSQESPYYHSMYYMNQSIQDKLWTYEDKLALLEGALKKLYYHCIFPQAQ